MGLKLIKYIVVDGKCLILDITQEISPNNKRCFHVEVYEGETFNFELCRNSDQEWHVVAQAYPNYIIVKIFKELVITLDRHLDYEKSYLLLN